jgi:hypothetical protein
MLRSLIVIFIVGSAIASPHVPAAALKALEERQDGLTAAEYDCHADCGTYIDSSRVMAVFPLRARAEHETL